jgi:Porin PorA
MRRILGYMLFVLGLMLVFLSPALLVYAVPRVEKAPTDVDNTVISNGTGNYFSATKLQYEGPAALQSIERYKGNPTASTDTVTVINYAQHTVVLGTRQSIDYDQEVFAMDRKSGMAVSCCGDKPRHSGVELKFPFDTQKTTYQLWDSSANHAFPAKFLRTETIDGLETYVFSSVTGPYKIGTIDLPGSLISSDQKGLVPTDRMYEAHTLAWAEPTTGAIVKGSRHVQQWAEQNGQKVLTLAELQVEYTPATVAKLADDAKTAKQQLQLVKTGLPIGGPIVGIVLVAVALLLLRRTVPTRRAPSRASQRVAA